MSEILPEEILKVKPYDRDSYFAEIAKRLRKQDLDPYMLRAVSGVDINEPNLPLRPVILFAFSSPGLLTWMNEDETDAHKLVKAAVTYGYMGSARSTGGINGILRLTDGHGDVALKRQLDSNFSRKNLEAKLEEYGFTFPLDITPVKIVAHVPSGYRIVGYMQKEPKAKEYDLRAVFLVSGNYNA